jgi:uncharacterized peroxidase-related enzyme
VASWLSGLKPPGCLSEFVDILLRQRNSLETGEREIIASYVSWLNECIYCHTIHGAIASHDFGGEEDLMDQVKQEYQSAPISDKLKALLTIAIKVCQGGKNVSRDARFLPFETPFGQENHAARQ